MWNVVHTNPNCDGQVARFLGLREIEVYAPQFPAPARTRPGSVRERRQRWVFPGYLFIKVPAAFQRWDLIRWAPGVRRVLSQDGSPSGVSDAVIDRLRMRLAASRTSSSSWWRGARSGRFVHGQRVVIDHGPLAMVDALFDRELNASERAQVLVHFLGRPMTVAVDAATLRPAN